jgi:hypothetical protein
MTACSAIPSFRQRHHHERPHSSPSLPNALDAINGAIRFDSGHSASTK